MRSRDYFLASIVFGVSLAGCATPGPVVRLAPAGGDVTWVAGRAVLSQEKSGVRVAAAFEHQDGGMLAVRVEVANDSEATLDVGPRGVSFVTCKHDGKESCGFARGVVDPEEVLMALDVGASRAAADAANDRAFYTPLLILSAASDVASIAGGRSNNTTGLRTAALANQMDNDAARHDSSMASYGQQRQMWSNAALRRSTVQPGRAQGGMVFVPIDLEARYVWIQVRAGGLKFPFRFQQTATQSTYSTVQYARTR
jgi:hypothetical protein